MELLAGTKQPRESDKAIIAFNDFARMGPGRSLVGLLLIYQSKGYVGNPPTTAIQTLKTWSSRYSWSRRAGAFDTNEDTKRTEDREAELAEGLSNDYYRVNKLKRLSAFLEDQIYEQDEEGRFVNVWVKETKVHGGITADMLKFNHQILTQFRGVLNDIADEVGGRVKKSERRSDGTQQIIVTGMDLDEI